LSRGTTVALDIVIGPGVEVKAVEGDSLFAYRDHHNAWPDFPIESVLVHAKVRRRIPKTDESGCEG